MITFIYTTCRKEPKLEWFVDSLYNQVVQENFDVSKIQIVVVDFELQYDESRKDKISDVIKNRFEFIHMSSKPSPWQGKYRICSRNGFSASLARNTGVCYAKYDYLVFVDDLSVLEPGSFKEIVECAKKKMVVAFAYKKVHELSIENGTIVHKKEHPGGIDSRWNQGTEFRRIGGSQLFGYSASPLEVILKVNGYDEICNGMGGEDYQYGMRVEKTGTEIFYNRKVVFNESEELADQGNVFMRRDPLLSKEQYDELMKKYGVSHRMVPNARTDLSHFILDLLTRDKYWTEGNSYDLRELRNQAQNKTLLFDTNFDPNLKTIEGAFLRDL